MTRRSVLIALTTVTFFAGGITMVKGADGAIDMNKARELVQKQKHGEKLSPDEQAYLDRARAERGKGQGGQQQNRGQRDGGNKDGETTPGKTSTGVKPLTELQAGDRYKDEDGGLYGGGRNTPPEAHQAAAAKEVAKIQPVDGAGKPSKDGKIVLLSIGMSNTTQEFSAFKAAIDADPRKSPNVILVDAAQGGQGAAEWTERNPERIWQTLDERIKRAGVTHKQVQALWLKQAEKDPKPDSMENARVLKAQLVTILNMAKVRCPNLRVVYLSSRTYGGYSSKHPEPESFETALSVRWVIQDQEAGKPELNWDPAHGAVKAPLLLWGPYLWADGLTPRKSDGLIWERKDFIADGTHPSESGRTKVVKLLTDFFTTDPNAKGWFVDSSKTPLP